MRRIIIGSILLVVSTALSEATPLHDSARAGRTDEVVNLSLLGDSGNVVAKHDALGEQPLYLASRYCDVEAVRALLYIKAPINAATRDGSTPLHGVARSIQKNASAIATLLIQRGADVHAVDTQGRTPLHVAAMNQPNVTRVLLAQELPLDQVDRQGRSALHWASETGNVSCAKLLIAAGASLDVQAPQAGTALHRAVFSNKPGMLKLLLASGANFTVKDALKNTPLKLALKMKRPELIQILVDAGAEE
jgi:ankyrin repeat protein